MRLLYYYYFFFELKSLKLAALILIKTIKRSKIMITKFFPKFIRVLKSKEKVKLKTCSVVCLTSKVLILLVQGQACLTQLGL